MAAVRKRVGTTERAEELRLCCKSAELTDLRYTEYEHFGFFDGIGDPVFEGQYQLQFNQMAQGQGHLSSGQWRPIAPGEFFWAIPMRLRKPLAIQCLTPLVGMEHSWLFAN